MSKSPHFDDLLKGASISQLATLFDMDRRTVRDRLRNTESSGERNSHPIYKISVAAQVLCDNSGAAAKRAIAQEVEFWDAKLKEQKFLEKAAELWPTAEVEKVLIGVLKIFRESYAMYIDRLETETQVPQEIIEEVKSLGDSMLEECHNSLGANTFRAKALKREEEKKLEADLKNLDDNDFEDDNDISDLLGL